MVIKLAKYIFPLFIIFGNHNLFSSEITSPTKNLEFNLNQAEVISGFPIEGNLVIAKTTPENKPTNVVRHQQYIRSQIGTKKA